MRTIGPAWATAVALAATAAFPQDVAADRVVVATASEVGVYHQVGRAICRLLALHEDSGGLDCEARPTDGSIDNVGRLLAGEVDIAIVQSDWQYHALHGSAVFAGRGPAENLRALFSVHAEPFTVVAREGTGIKAFQDLRGRRVNVGNPGSGQRATMEVVLAALGWRLADFQLAEELPADQQGMALCHDRVEALVYTVGHPNPAIAHVASVCDGRIIPVEAPEIDELVEARPYYAHAVVPGGIYPNNPEPVDTFGVRATVVSRAEVDDELVYTVVRAVFDQLETFKGMHPAAGILTAESMLQDGLSAPFHEGALRYFVEADLPLPEPEPEDEEAAAD